MLLWPVIGSGGIRKGLESWVNGARKTHPQVLALLSDVFERHGEIAPDPLESRPPPVAGWSRRDG